MGRQGSNSLAVNGAPAIVGMLSGRALCACGRWESSKTKGMVMVIGDMGFRWGKMREVV